MMTCLRILENDLEDSNFISKLLNCTEYILKLCGSLSMRSPNSLYVGLTAKVLQISVPVTDFYHLWSVI